MGFFLIQINDDDDDDDDDCVYMSSETTVIFRFERSVNGRYERTLQTNSAGKKCPLGDVAYLMQSAAANAEVMLTIVDFPYHPVSAHRSI